MSEFDASATGLGPCEKCGTTHEGYAPGTLGGEMRCIRAQAVAEGAPGLVDQVDALAGDVARHRDDALAAFLEEPKNS